jgi:hypothetical protein
VTLPAQKSAAALAAVRLSRSIADCFAKADGATKSDAAKRLAAALEKLFLCMMFS